MPFSPNPPFAQADDTAGLQALHGLTILAVEDSRLACDALRLMCQRSGARLRRAEGVAQARSHLAVYRPDLVLVDLGLPDGRGEALIRDLAAGTPPVIIAMSGDPSGRSPALAAGAAAFIEKPIPGLRAFQQVVLAVLPDGPGRALSGFDAALPADPMALRDDLSRAARALAAAPGPDQRAYLSGFLAGIARQTADAPLTAASACLHDPGAALEPLARLLHDRLAAGVPFARR